MLNCQPPLGVFFFFLNGKPDLGLIKKKKNLFVRLVYRENFLLRGVLRLGAVPKRGGEGQQLEVDCVNRQRASMGSSILPLPEPQVPGFFPYYL